MDKSVDEGEGMPSKESQHQMIRSWAPFSLKTALAKIELPPRHTPVSTKHPGIFFAKTSSMHDCRLFNRFEPAIVKPKRGQSRPCARASASNFFARTIRRPRRLNAEI